MSPTAVPLGLSFLRAQNPFRVQEVHNEPPKGVLWKSRNLVIFSALVNQ